MSRVSARTMPISLGRRITSDFLHVGMGVPMVTLEKRMDVSELADARQTARPRPSWCAIFTKAYAQVAAARPELRRAYLSFPWERLAEYDEAVADIVVENRADAEDVLTTMRLAGPGSLPLMEIDRRLRAHKEQPIEKTQRFRRALRLARLPRCLRRPIWWWIANGSAQKRGRYFGTFGVSSVANWGTESLRPIAPWTSLLHYGTVDAAGQVTMRMSFDHRVMDGSGGSKALLALEQVLQTELAAELASLREQTLETATDDYVRWQAAGVASEQGGVR